MLALLLALWLAPGAVISGQQPQLARIGNDVFVVVARDAQVGVLRSRDEGRSFTEATPIAVTGRMSAGMHRGPRVAATRSVVLVSFIAGIQGGGTDGDVLLYRSVDGGATWAQPAIINDVPAAAREGLHGMAARDDGLAVITWLDLRAKGTRLYGAVSRDHGATWSSDVLIYESPEGSICECCHPSVATNQIGVTVMFRNSLAGARDLYVTRSADGRSFSAAEKQGTGTWTLNACPMDGGGIGLTPAGPATVWRREGDIFLTTPGVAEQRLGTGRDPSLALAPSGVDVAWTTPEGVRLWRGAGSILLGPGRFPAVVAFPGHTLAAWEHQGQIVTKVVVR